MDALLPVRVVASHRYTATSFLIGALAFLILPAELSGNARMVYAWDAGATALLLLFLFLLLTEGDADKMARNAAAQEEGEWTVFAITLVGVAVSFIALTSLLGEAKNMDGLGKKLTMAAVGGTLFLSWLVTHVVFALRYAHEYYQRTPRAALAIDGGLEFPGGLPPDYWDFLYFALVLGMTFQVSDVQITSRKLRRLATVHGLVGFLFNTVIVALTVNLAASLL